MKGTKRTTLFTTLAVLAAVACEPAENGPDRWTDDPEARTPTPEMRAQMNELRAEVESVLNELRTEIDQLRELAREEEPRERVTRVATRYEETRGDIMSDLEEARTADDHDELRRVRDRTSERLAELEADVVRAELETTRDAGTLSQRVEQQLSALESDLAEIRARVAERPRSPEAREEPGVRDRVEGWFDDDIDEREIENLRDDLMELRQEAARIQERVRDDDFESVRDDLSGNVADLTQDVRKHWYALRWMGDATHRQDWDQDPDRPAQPQDRPTEQY